MRIVVQRLLNAEERCREIATEKVPQRLSRTLCRLVGQVGRPSEGGVLVALTREELAQMTGTTLFTVSRLFSQWEEQGVIRPRREGVLIDDAAGLDAASPKRPDRPARPAATDPLPARRAKTRPRKIASVLAKAQGRPPTGRA